jgi:hypothetical protein
MSKAHWIAGPRFDSLWIIGPHFFSVALVAFWSFHGGGSTLPLWAWLFGVLFVDVAHVYATLFRTYFHQEGRKKWAFLLVALPVIVFMLGYFLFKVTGAGIYWRVLAYVAAFHFIRQQYGFFKIYNRADRSPAVKKKFDEIFLYSLMLLPLIYWHTHLPRDFEWFVVGDFVALPTLIWKFSVIAWAFLFAGYVASEIRHRKHFNLPKNLLFIATAFSWMVGIIYFNGDFAFTLTNTLSHGIPYMALVLWTTYGKKSESSFKFSLHSIAVSIIASLFLLWFLAYFEEGLWDYFVWHEREILFRPFKLLSGLGAGLGTAFWVAFLSVPQVTHYFLDGFIWKLRDPTRDLKRSLL